MELVKSIGRALSTMGHILSWGREIQEPARAGLIADLQRICDICEQAYQAVLESYSDPHQLAIELRRLAADGKTRDAFKPDHLCGEVDSLLDRLESNLDPLKYSLDFNRLRAIRSHLQGIGNVDGALYSSYDEFSRSLDQVATDIQTGVADPIERAAYVQQSVRLFEEDLTATLRDVRAAKDAILLREV